MGRGRNELLHPRRKLLEESPDHLGGSRILGELEAPEPVDLVAGQPETPVLGYHFRVERWLCDVALGVVLLTVDLDDHSLSVAEQQQEVLHIAAVPAASRWTCPVGCADRTGRSAGRPVG